MTLDWPTTFGIIVYSGGVLGASLAQIQNWNLRHALRVIGISITWPFWFTSVLVERMLSP